MLSGKMQDALNDQVAAEIYSAHLYLSMSAWFDSVDMPGAANWMRIQYQEEIIHGLKIFDYVMERDARAVIKAIESPPAEWSSALDAFSAAYNHEQKVTAMIGKLVDLARAEKDHATEFFLHWFVNEQVEEEASAKAIVQKLKLVEESKNGLFMIDRELGTRVFTPPVQAG
ncbi:MAG: ferritin [Deltaproteobacteria bacterium]|nr:ferritin [Deltaproteobacteria bacterium]